jgi:Methyltransferase domain
VDLTGLLADPPGAHLDSEGNRFRWEVASRVLEIMDRHLGPGSRTLETGAGVSTGMFAIKGCEHDCIVPWTSEIERIRAWGDRTGVSLDRITFHCAPSEDVLPKLDPTPLDFVLIDGGHGFPTPFIDWWYGGRRLKRGGLLVIDDTEIWTGGVLSKFLRADGDWEVVESLPMRSVVFRRVAEPDNKLVEWVDQPYVIRRSFVGGPRGLIRKAVRGVAGLRDRRR